MNCQKWLFTHSWDVQNYFEVILAFAFFEWIPSTNVSFILKGLFPLIWLKYSPWCQLEWCHRCRHQLKRNSNEIELAACYMAIQTFAFMYTAENVTLYYMLLCIIHYSISMVWKVIQIYNVRCVQHSYTQWKNLKIDKGFWNINRDVSWK